MRQCVKAFVHVNRIAAATKGTGEELEDEKTEQTSRLMILFRDYKEQALKVQHGWARYRRIRAAYISLLKPTWEVVQERVHLEWIGEVVAVEFEKALQKQKVQSRLGGTAISEAALR